MGPWRSHSPLGPQLYDANRTQAHRFWRASRLGAAAFVALLHEAKQRVRTTQGKQGAGRITHKMAYYVRCLTDRAGVPAKLGPR